MLIHLHVKESQELKNMQSIPSKLESLSVYVEISRIFLVVNFWNSLYGWLVYRVYQKMATLNIHECL